jgi:hypothetical protein
MTTTRDLETATENTIKLLCKVDRPATVATAAREAAEQLMAFLDELVASEGQTHIAELKPVAASA